MDDFQIKRTFNTPEIELIPSLGTLLIEGRSIPEDPEDFFESVISALNDYFRNPQKLTKVTIKLEYVNSGSSKYILEVLRMLKNYHDKGMECEVNWYYEEDDESILELGNHYKNTIRIPFNIIDYY